MSMGKTKQAGSPLCTAFGTASSVSCRARGATLSHPHALDKAVVGFPALRLTKPTPMLSSIPHSLLVVKLFFLKKYYFYTQVSLTGQVEERRL